MRRWHGPLLAVVASVALVTGCATDHGDPIQPLVKSASCDPNTFQVMGPPAGTNLEAEILFDEHGHKIHATWQHICDDRTIRVDAAWADFTYDAKHHTLRVTWSAKLPVVWLGICLSRDGGAWPYEPLKPTQTSRTYQLDPQQDVHQLWASVAAKAPSLPPPYASDAGGGMSVQIQPVAPGASA